MQNVISQTHRPYAGKSFYYLKDVVEDNWNDFDVLADIHGQTLHKRKTEWSIGLCVETEERLKKLVFNNRNKPAILQEMCLKLVGEETEFAINLRCEIEERLEELKSEYFRFPSTELTGAGFGEMEIIDRQKKGLLLAVGYSTGVYGLHDEPRRKILDSVYTKGIPKNTKVNDVKKWGEPRTSKRLKKIADSLAHFTKQEKGNYRGDYTTSISDRESDLNYLKKKYYDGRYDFPYPKT